ncbi:hypothetical protein J437_LFUL016001 [Ladona fulva]|uniref:ZP domain-containing protein n=1 Tax=Ladona fulva TaxID=123851 RepID=A0A8K0P7C3_LADFU|nr:hypothetical protein J437_LFUL016001 [Ladona fulva]
MASLHVVRRGPGAALPFLALLLLASSCVGQSNYASQGNSIEFEAPSEENNFGLPQQTILDGKVTKLDDLSPVELKFDSPFFGIAYADFDRNSACMVHGKGALTYTLDLPLKGCGTVQNPQRVFTNNVVVRFHPGLEMDGDEVITVVCRYPPPQAPAPPLTLPRVVPPATAAASEPPLKGFHILLIICAILFLTLLLLGLGCSYYCLRHRRAAPLLLPPSRPPSSATTQGPLPFHSSAASTASSDATKLSSGTISMFEGLKIPRVQAGSASLPAAAVVHASTASDTLPSDYPSESLSSEEEMEVDGRRLISTRAMVNRRPSTLSSAGSFENAAYQREEETVQTATAVYSDTDVARIATPPAVVPPKFDVSLRVKRAPPAPPSPPPPPSSPSVLSDVTSIASAMRQQERNLTTILEREESSRMPPPMPLLQPPPTTTFSYVPELHPPPATVTIAARPPPPPSNVYSRVVKSPQQQYTYSQQREWSEIQAARDIEDDTEILRGVQIIESPPRLRASPPPRSLASLNTENTDTRSVSEIIESAPSKPYYAASPPPPPIMPTGVKVMQSSVLEDRMDAVSETGELPEPPVVVSRRPEIISHVVDDVFLRTVTEKRTIEDIERRRRAVTNVNPPPQPPPPKKWDVVIRNYPDPNPPPPAPSSVASSSTLCWERQSDFTDAASDYQGPPEENLPQPEPLQRESTPPRPRYSSETVQREMTRETETTRPLPPMIPAKELGQVPNWDVLIRVLEPPPVSIDSPRVERALSEGTTDYDTAPETDNDTDSVRTPVPEDFAETEEEVTSRLVKTTLTEADREKWRQIITTESTLRTLLTEATVREDFERIRRDSRYQTLFEPHKWDVIIRVLAPPPSSASSSQGGRSRPPYRRSKSTEWDNRSRRSSLPTLYEYDSDTAASSVSTRRPPEDEIDGGTGVRRAPSSPARSRRGRAPSSVYSDAPFSVSEVVVDHSRPDPGDAMSDASGHTVTSTGSSFFNQAGPGQPRQHYLPRKGARFQRRRFEDSEEDDEEEERMTGSLVRSVSQPSLARSASEFTEQWAVEKRGYGDFYDDEDFFEDGMSSPRSGRSRTSSGVASAVRRARRQAEINSQMKHSSSAELLAASSSRSNMATREASLPIGSIRMTTTTLESESVRRVVRDSWYDEERKE